MVTVLYHVDSFGIDKTRLSQGRKQAFGQDDDKQLYINRPWPKEKTAEHCCICIPGRACVERFV